MNEAEKYDYDVLFIGDDYVEQAVNEMNKKNNTRFRFVRKGDVNSNINMNSNSNSNMLLANSNPILSL